MVRGAALTILVALAAVFVFLAVEGWDGLTGPPASFAPFTSFVSYVSPLLLSTLLAAAIAVIVAVPFAIAVALFISHYAPRRLAAPLAYVVDLLAAIPSVVFGLWGGRYLAAYLQPLHVWLHEHLGFLPFFGPGPPSPNGRSLFTAGIVLAIMILPIITAISREVFAADPAAPRGGGARARRDALGDGPLRRLPARALRHGLRRHARARVAPSARRWRSPWCWPPSRRPPST